MSKIDVNEDKLLRDYPEILQLLLIDRTTNKNIIWATNSYEEHGYGFFEQDQITVNKITGIFSGLIKPRIEKSADVKRNRTKSKAEVFTPTWVVKKQNDLIEKQYKNDNVWEYVSRIWLEVSCGEAPYMTTRYDMETGKFIPINNRVGFIDRKLKRVNKEIDRFNDWMSLVIKSFKSSYGFEWSGDSLLLARENLLYTFRDFYYSKWEEEPNIATMLKIAEVISFNVFQMDGVKFIVPLSDQVKREKNVQLSLFEDDIKLDQIGFTEGIRVKIMDWSNEKMEYFDKGIKNG